MISYCEEYAVSQACTRCQKNYHLEDGLCYRDLIGCLGYYGPICVECGEWGILVENRCLYDCRNFRELGKIMYRSHGLCL